MTEPRLRAALDAVPEYRAGQGAPVGSYKISSNENPYLPLPSVERALQQAISGLNRYPDFASTELVEALAARFDVGTEQISVGTGSVGVAQQLVQATAGPGDEVLFAWRSFEAYPIISRLAGATAVQVPLDREDRHDLDAMLAAITPQTRLIFVCNPNNPTGTAVRRADLVRFLDAVPADALVVLDEAYGEFVRDPEVPDGLELARNRANVAVLRTFSKAYGLAGLRIGYAIASVPVAAALRKTAVPFGVSSLAQTAAVASLAAEDELLERVAALVIERQRLQAGLIERGWHVSESEANFVWLRLGERAEAFADACLAAGVVVRPFPGEGVRITIGEAAATDLVLKVAETG